MLLISCALFVVGKDRTACALAYLSLLLSLTTVDLLLFYFDQFSTIITAIIQFCVFMGTVYYQQIYLRPVSIKPPLQTDSLAVISSQENETDGL